MIATLLPCSLLLQLEWTTCSYCFGISHTKTAAGHAPVTNCVSSVRGSRISHSEAVTWIPVATVNECVLAMLCLLSDVSLELATLPLLGEWSMSQQWGEGLLVYCRLARRFWVGSTAMIAKAGVICRTRIGTHKRAISDYSGEFLYA
jgi:hypothetical protein